MGADGALMWALAGGLAGSLATLVPGLHVNTLSALVLFAVVTGNAQPTPAVPFLIGALGASTFVHIVPLVVLGVPEGEDAPALMPGQRLARRGRTREALAAGAWGSVVGLLAGTALALAFAWLLPQPGVAAGIARATPWVAAAVLAVLVGTDGAGLMQALAVAALAGALGLVALGLPLASPFALPSSVLLPLFAGLFGLPALLFAARASEPGLPIAGRAGRDRDPTLRGPLLGSLLGVMAGLFAGFTSGPATALAALVRPTHDEDILATTSAVNTAGACVATAVLHALGRARSGVHAAELALAPPPGTPDALLSDLAALATGAVVGLVAIHLLSRVAGSVTRVVPRIARALLLPWAGLIVVFGGWPGVLVAAAGYTVARCAIAWGTRRSLLMAVLLVPAILRPLG